MEYTEKLHAEGLLEIFSQERPCGRCPADIGKEKQRASTWWENEKRFFYDDYCGVCWAFIGGDRWAICPCWDDNETRAAKATWLALEAKGYLE